MAEPMIVDVEPVDPATRAAWRAESAGRHLVERVPVVDEARRVGDVVDELAAGAHDVLDAVYVTGADRRLRGAVRLPDLFRADRARAIGDVVDPGYPRVDAHADQEHVAAEALARRATSVAIVDDAGRLIGVVPALALLDVLRREHVEDLHRLAGIAREHQRELSALEAPPLRRARHRLPWLMVGLAGSMLAALIMSGFERALEGNLALAFFVPAIVYLADAIGTQTEAIVVRGLSLSRQPLRHPLAGELRTGLVMGALLGAVALPLVWLAFGDVRLAATVAIAVLVAGSVATTISLVLPWALQRAGSDPAFGSGPVATIIQDVLSLVIYFAVASLLMPG